MALEVGFESVHFGPFAIHAPALTALLSSRRIESLSGRFSGTAQALSGALSIAPDANGIAMIELHGPLAKEMFNPLWGDGTSTLVFRAALRAAVETRSVRGVLVHIDSPGGTVAGTADAAEAVRQANEVKPVFAHIDDLGASAAYWIASQARKVYANPTALVGSIGTYSVLYDLSEYAAKQGVKVHVISTGPYKGAGEPGAEISDPVLKNAQRIVNGLNEHFLKAVKSGRSISSGQVERVADGKVWIAGQAKSLGLLDEVQDFNASYAALADLIARRTAQREAVKNRLREII